MMRKVWVILLIVSTVGGLCLIAKLRHRHRPVLSTPPHESLPMPPVAPDRG